MKYYNLSHFILLIVISQLQSLKLLTNFVHFVLTVTHFCEKNKQHNNMM